ncbi:MULTISPECIES: beta barrel domain-containing protein [unclassified Levilactobacillus]|uniref:beta barrel domain-containing protein n=1 Tax=unclassified Levilactobacillus TaxID=2767918 RepID=UPI002FF2886D
MRLSEVSVGQKLYLIHSSRGAYRTYDVDVTRVNTSSIYVKEPDDDYERRFTKKGKFPLRENDPFGGWLGSNYLTNVSNQADLWEQRSRKISKLNGRINYISAKLQSIDDLKRREQVVMALEECLNKFNMQVEK